MGENKIIRPMGEPRIHLAIVCASVSCPDLPDLDIDDDIDYDWSVNGVAQ